MTMRLLVCLLPMFSTGLKMQRKEQNEPRNFGPGFDGIFTSIAPGESCFEHGLREPTLSECLLASSMWDNVAPDTQADCPDLETNVFAWTTCPQGSVVQGMLNNGNLCGPGFGTMPSSRGCPADYGSTESACTRTPQRTVNWRYPTPHDIRYFTAQLGTPDSADRKCGSSVNDWWDGCYCVSGTPHDGSYATNFQQISAGQSCASQGWFEPTYAECATKLSNLIFEPRNNHAKAYENVDLSPCAAYSSGAPRWPHGAGNFYVTAAYSGNAATNRLCPNNAVCWCTTEDFGPVGVSSGGGASGKGDPHMMNMKGERFNIVRQGYAPLITIPNDLEILARIDGAKKCSKKMFISAVNASGSWLEKKVAVFVGNQMDDAAFHVTVDGEPVWSPKVKDQVDKDEKTVFDGKFSMNTLSSMSGKKEPGIEIKMMETVKMTISRPMHRDSTTPHLNFDIKGLRGLPSSFKVGGILGLDDHSKWSGRDEECVNLAKIISVEAGSTAVAA